MELLTGKLATTCGEVSLTGRELLTIQTQIFNENPDPMVLLLFACFLA